MSTFLYESIGALLGIRDLFIKYPAELRLHRYAVIEKLRERIDDENKVVCETLYQLFKSVIFPGCKEVTLSFFENQINKTIMCLSERNTCYEHFFSIGTCKFGWGIPQFGIFGKAYLQKDMEALLGSW